MFDNIQKIKDEKTFIKYILNEFINQIKNLNNN